MRPIPRVSRERKSPVSTATLPADRSCFASSLSGYVNSHIAFAIIQNGHPISYWWAREAQDRFARVLATQ